MCDRKTKWYSWKTKKGSFSPQCIFFSVNPWHAYVTPMNKIRDLGYTVGHLLTSVHTNIAQFYWIWISYLESKECHNFCLQCIICMKYEHCLFLPLRRFEAVLFLEFRNILIIWYLYFCFPTKKIFYDCIDNDFHCQCKYF